MNNIQIRFSLIAISILFFTSVFAADGEIESDLNRDRGPKGTSTLPQVFLAADSESSVGPTGPNFLTPTAVYATGPTGASGQVYIFCSSQVREELFGANTSSLKVELEPDPAIHYYNSEVVKVDGRSLLSQETEARAASLLRVNELDLSNSNLQGGVFDFLWSPEIDLSCIRTLNLSCNSGKGAEYDANRFLAQLFQNSKSLRSLMFIDIANSNVTLDTLKIWRTTTEFNGPLIRDAEKTSVNTGTANTGWKVASLTCKNISTTHIIQCSMSDKRELQRATQRLCATLYRLKGYEKGTAHLQIVLER